MIEIGPTTAETAQSPTNAPAGHDFSVLQGFQVVGAEDRLAAQKAAGEDAWRDAVRLELEARAARFHQAVDAAIVLSNDGVIRWLGDPVARLSAGANVLAPKTVIFADESLPEASQDIVRTRIDLWLSATIRRTRGAAPCARNLFRKDRKLVRDLAGRLARSLGILERETIRSQVKALTQDERAELRKQGVRFGGLLYFRPCADQTRRKNPRPSPVGPSGGGRPGRAGESAGPVASSGRTSLALDGAIPKRATASQAIECAANGSCVWTSSNVLPAWSGRRSSRARGAPSAGGPVGRRMGSLSMAR